MVIPMKCLQSIHVHVWQSGACQAFAAQAVAFLLIIHRAQPTLQGRPGACNCPTPPSSSGLANIWHPRCHARLATHTLPQQDGPGLFKRVARSYLDTPSCLQVPPPHPTQRRPPPPTSRVMASVMARQFCHLQNGHHPPPPLLPIPPIVLSHPVSTPLRVEQWQEKLASHPNREWVVALLTGMRCRFRISLQAQVHCRAMHRNAPSALAQGPAVDKFPSPAASKWSHHRPTAPTGLPRHHYKQYSGYSQKDTGAVEGVSRSVKSCRSQRQ